MTEGRRIRIVVTIAVVFSIIAFIGATHSFLRGYSDIYTAIFIMLGAGYLFIGYILWEIGAVKK